MNLASLEQAFITERRYLKNVTRKTLSWYACSFSAFRPFLANVKGEDDLKPMVKTAVLELAERGLSPVSINVYLRCLNAFMKWLHDEEHIGVPIRIAPLKTEKKVLAVLTPEQVQQLVAYRPRGKNEIRAHTLALLILDTGMRADEALNVRKQDVDLDNLLVTVIKGKGQKQRIVPFSFQLRRVLFKQIGLDISFRSPYIKSFMKNAFGGVKWPKRTALRSHVLVCSWQPFLWYSSPQCRFLLSSP
jgi:integrase/recombinase XerD